MSHRMSDATVLDGINRKLLSPESRRAIIACARRSLGEQRDLRSILATAKKHGADPKTVAAAFAFLPNLRHPSRYVDVIAADEDVVALLPQGAELAAAFALSRAVHPSGGSFATS
jgi:hypothetical protein